MYVIKLGVFCTALCILMKGATALQSELSIEGLQYSREDDGCAAKGTPQLTDKFVFRVPSGFPAWTAVSLFLFDSEERVWVQASANRNERSTCDKPQCLEYIKPGLKCREYKTVCQKYITLSKPLIGYDLLKKGGCDGEEFKTQPFTPGRWGEETDEDEDSGQCYMIAVGSNGQSTSQMYPDQCAEKAISLYKEDNSPAVEKSLLRPKRSTFSVSITQFTKTKIRDNRKFVCKVAYSFHGYLTSLGLGFPVADVKVYYRRNNSEPWGSHLLNLARDQFSNGENWFVSWVSKQHLNGQGVGWMKCFKCEVTVNGAVRRSCHGGCVCN